MSSKTKNNIVNIKDFNLNKFISKRLKYARIMKRMSQTELANNCGLRQNIISSMENGKSITTINLFKVSKALDISLSKLFKGLETEMNQKFKQ